MRGWIGGGHHLPLLSKGWIKFALTNEACHEWTRMDTKLGQAEGTGPIIVGQIVERSTMRRFLQNILKMLSVTVLCPPGNKFLFSRVVITPRGWAYHIPFYPRIMSLHLLAIAFMLIVFWTAIKAPNSSCTLNGMCNFAAVICPKRRHSTHFVVVCPMMKYIIITWPAYLLALNSIIIWIMVPTFLLTNKHSTIFIDGNQSEGVGVEKHQSDPVIRSQSIWMWFPNHNSQIPIHQSKPFLSQVKRILLS